MRSVLTLARKDLQQTFRDKLAALFTFILPIIFTAFFGFLFGGTGEEKLPVALRDLDGGTAAQDFRQYLESSGTITFRVYETDQELESMVQLDQVAAGIIIPTGFNQDAEQGASLQEPVTVVGKLGSTGAQSVLQLVQTSLNRVLAARRAAGTALNVLGVASPSAGELDQALQAANAVYEQPALALSVTSAGTRTGEVPSGFEQSSPGMIVNWMLFSLLGPAITLVLERRNGSLRRLLTTRVRSGQVIAGKAGAMVAMTMIQQVVLISLGQFAFGVDYLRNPAALVLTMLSLSLLAAGLGMMIASLLKTEQAVVTTTVFLSMVLAAMGGAWFPLEIAGPTFSAIGHLTPAAWILDAFKGIILRGWSVGQVIPSLAVVWGYAAVFFGVALWRFRFE